MEPLTPDHAFFEQLSEADGGTGEVSKPTKTVLNLKTGIVMPAGTIITIDFPRFNPEAPGSLQKSYFLDSDNVGCIALESADPGLVCEVSNIEEELNGETLTDRLTITGAFPSGLEREATIRIEVDSIYNPLSMSERDMFTALAIISSNDGKNYHIEEGYTALRATKPTTISNVEITASDHTVQEHVDFTIRFQPDVEINAGAYALVKFPHLDSFGHRTAFDFDNQL